MKSRSLIGSLLVLAVLCAGGWWWWQQQRTAEAPRFRTSKVERGALTAAVSASGTLAATVQVQVSSQVSGQIREVLVDFNAEVRKGEVLARLDPETFEYRVRQAEADLEAARAQVGVQQATVAARNADLSRVRINLEESRRDLERKQDLVARNFISPAERDKAQSVARALEQDLASAGAQVELAEAQVRNARSVVQQREAQLASARVDLGRTVIRAPVDGVVIKRSIEPGQTVAASLQAPELFVIAQNLRDMQVEVSIDEAEVARLRVGQRTTFTVDAFPGRTFEGTVRQVRKASKNEQNVITYTAVVSAENESLSLLPGMTANVRIVTDVRENVLKVPNSALRFKPPGWTDPPKSASIDGPLRVAVEALLPAASAQPQGGGLQALRERLDRELALTDAQKPRIDAAFAAARERGAAIREASEAERPALIERSRSEFRAAVVAVLDPAQRQTFAAINAEIDARRAAAGAGAASPRAAGTPAAPAGDAKAADAARRTQAPVAGATGPGPSTAGAGAATAGAATPGAAAPAVASPGTTPGSPSAGGGDGAGASTGGPMAQFRQRLVRDLALTESQRSQLDEIFAAMRERFAAVREAPPADRPKLVERNRAELRARIGDILDPAQKKKYGEILVELSGRTVGRGRVFVPDADGKPTPVELRLGLSDGVSTEVVGFGGEARLAEGDLVFVGVISSTPATPSGPARPGGPRL
jgi:HlyD family secretion protein